ncbi:PRD domain-containing protein [Gemmiger sp.]
MTKKEELMACIETLLGEPSRKEAGLTTQELAEKMAMQRTNISTLLNELVQDGKLDKVQGRPVRYRLPAADANAGGENTCFGGLVGCDGSLKPVIRLAKAAVLYPGQSLSTLITGPSGSGKTTFAYLMYQFARDSHILSAAAPFVRVSCHEDEDAPTLQQRLFAPDGALAEAKGGVLFVDNLQCLASELRKRLLELVESDAPQLHDCILICAMNDKVRQSLLDDCTARFSARVQLPALQSRPLSERFALVKRFLIEEASRMRHTLRADAEILHCLCLYHAENSIKQLKSDIRLGCANAYVRAFGSESEELNLYLHDFPDCVRRGLLYYKMHHAQVEALIQQDCTYSFSDDAMQKENRAAAIPQIGHMALSDSIYDVLDHKAEELKRRGLEEEEVGRIINAELEYDMSNLTTQLNQTKFSREGLYKIMDRRIVDGVDALLKEASRQFNKVYPETTFYGLCLHVSSMIERGGTPRQHLPNERILEVVEKYRKEYALCTQFVAGVEKELGISLSIDESVLITLFLCSANAYDPSQSRPVILVAMHGESTASSMVDVVNALAGCENTYAYDMPLDKDMQQAYDELKALVQEIDRGRGILLILDMGSLRTMAELIQKETGIKIRTVAIPGTLIAMDCARKACSAETLDDLFSAARTSWEDFYTQTVAPVTQPRGKKVILTLCMTGQGGAKQMKSYLEKNAALKDTMVIPLAVSDRKELLHEVSRLKEKYEIHCVIGTYNPGLYEIPFISVAQLFETPVDKLEVLLSMPDTEREKVDYEMIYSYLSEQLQTLDVKKLRRCLPDAMGQIKKAAQGLSQDQELGLFLHIACAIDRIQNGDTMPSKGNRQSIISRNKRLYNDLREILGNIETAFGIEFSDDEIAYIIAIIKKL